MVRWEKRRDFAPFFNLDLMGVESFNFQWNNKWIRLYHSWLHPDRKFGLAYRTPERPLPASTELVLLAVGRTVFSPSLVSWLVDLA